MKKITTALLCFLLVLGISGCSDNSKKEAGEQTSKDTLDLTQLNAKDIITIMQDSGIPITNIIVYDESTDPNKLLGRPDGYTSKINFADRRIAQSDPDNPKGGTIEVFSNHKDASERKDYVESVAKGILAQYHYLYENVYMRLDRDLTPEQAEEYETAFQAMQEGKKPAAITYSPSTLDEKMIYHGYTTSMPGSFMKIMDEDTTYYLSTNTKTFEINIGMKRKKYDWINDMDDGGVKEVFEKELKDIGLTLSELN